MSLSCSSATVMRISSPARSGSAAFISSSIALATAVDCSIDRSIARSLLDARESALLASASSRAAMASSSRALSKSVTAAPADAGSG